MDEFRRICVFCGSAPGDDSVYAETTIALAKHLAARGVAAVYGGGKVGLMGVLANAMLVSKGEVIGVIPEKLRSHEVAHEGLTELFVVETMHARKALMTQLSDAFIAMPGGFGTLDELFEAITWRQLGYHHKPVGILNVKGYFDPLVKFLDQATSVGFIQDRHRELIHISSDAEDLLEKLQAARIPTPRASSKPSLV